MIQLTILVKNKLGLHARAAAKLVRLASGFTSSIYLCRAGADQQIDSKSILGILMLAAAQGTCLMVSIDGRDEVEAGKAIQSLFERNFGEEN
jgi:phosphotransferase system HPr (HPr) family protein